MREVTPVEGCGHNVTTPNAPCPPGDVTLGTMATGDVIIVGGSIATGDVIPAGGVATMVTGDVAATAGCGFADDNPSAATRATLPSAAAVAMVAGDLVMPAADCCSLTEEPYCPPLPLYTKKINNDTCTRTTPIKQKVQSK